MSILANTKTQMTGIIPFGSTDPSIIMQNSLKSAAGVLAETNATGELLNGATAADFDSNYGFKGVGEKGLKFGNLVGASILDNAFQFSFTIETEFIANYEPTKIIAGTVGVDHNTNDYLISWAAVDTGTPFGRVYLSAVGDNLVYQGVSTGGKRQVGMTDLGADRFSVITFSRVGKNFDIYRNGAFLETLDAGYAVDLFKNFYFASFRGTSSGNGTLDYYIRDFIVSSRPVMSPAHPMLSNVSWGGDSFPAGAFPPASSFPGNGYDHSGRFIVDGYLNNRGIKINLVNRGKGGSVVNTSFGTEWLTSTEGQSFLADVSPIKLLQIGTNDSNLNETTWALIDFYTDYTNLIAAIMATTDYLVVGNVPTLKGNSNYWGASYESQTQQVNGYIKQVVAEWHTANPSRNGSIKESDLFTLTGGEAADDDMINGAWTGLNNDLHLSSRGRKIEAEDVARLIYEFL